MSLTRTLARHVALRDPDDYPTGTCVAWMDGPDRVCGKPGDYLCPRHHKVATRKQQQAIERTARDRARAEQKTARAREKAAEQRPARVAELARVEARIARLDPSMRPFDHGEQNLPLARRMPTDNQIHDLAVLHRRRAELVQIIGGAL